MRSKLVSSSRKRRRKESSNADGEDEGIRMHSKRNGDKVLSTLEGGDKQNPITNADTIRCNMIGKGDNAPAVCLKNVVCRDDEMVGKNTLGGKKTLGSLTLEKIRQKHGWPNNSVKGPLKERLILAKPKVEVKKTPLKKRIELIKRSREEEEQLVLVKREACSIDLSR